MRLTAVGDTIARDPPYHILTKPWGRMRHIIFAKRRASKDQEN